MPYNQNKRDAKNNLVVVTLFESYLSKLILENPNFYKAIYFKILDAIECHLETLSLNRDFGRHLFAIFSRVAHHYPKKESFSALKSPFDLASTDYCLKLIADELLARPEGKALKTIDETTVRKTPSPSSFFNQTKQGKRSPYNPLRCPYLFDEKNRGVSPIRQTDDDSEEETQDLGIAEDKHTPIDLKNYHLKPIQPARFSYAPKEDSFVARWLRGRHLRVIAGSSGSTEILFSRILPLVKLEPAEIEVLVFAQACNMVANGHHSLFEALLVSDYFGLKIEESATLFEFYIKCIPSSIQSEPIFIQFINDPSIKELLEGIPLYVEGDVSEPVKVPGVRM